MHPARECWSAFASWYGLRTDEVFELVPGRSARDIVSHLSDRLSVPTGEALDRYLKFSGEHHTGISPIKGARELLASLPANRWVVVTSGTRNFALGRIASAGLPEPPQLITADDVTAGKPDPEPYRVAAERIGFNPSQCIAVDDAPAGIASASAAGCRTLGVLTTHSREAMPGADAYVEDLSKIRVTSEDDALRVTWIEV
jgi:mannitol-1-/sugar-/sorbitol-6-phosphatase